MVKESEVPKRIIAQPLHPERLFGEIQPPFLIHSKNANKTADGLNSSHDDDSGGIDPNGEKLLHFCVTSSHHV